MANLTFIGKIIKATKAATFWKDGDGESYHWNYWNPIAWPFIVFIVLAVFVLGGLKELFDNPHYYGLTYSKYWKSRLKQRDFV